MTGLLMSGCRPRPLSSYLKSLAVMRLLSTQKDPNLTASWVGDRLLLHTLLLEEDVLDFFANEFSPSPLVAPWNGGSGFFPKDQKKGIDAVAKSESGRFSRYRETIQIANRVLQELQILDKPDSGEKDGLLINLRNELPDEAVQWLDSVVLLTSDKIRFPPLLGTGGNDGRLEFTNNFMQRLSEVIDCATGLAPQASVERLRSSLFGVSIPGLSQEAVGQFDPSSAGGVNGSTGFEGAEAVNPWDYIFMLEGSLVFSAAATRRTENSGGSLSYPFTFESSGSGSGAFTLSDDSTSRAEMWLPLWAGSASFSEIKQLFSEGRITVGRKTARDGVDVVRAIVSSGVDRGIASFERYSFAQRNGLAYLATPLARIEVRRELSGELLDELQARDWLTLARGHARRDEATASIRRVILQLENAVFELTRRAGPPVIQRILIALGELNRQLALSPKSRESLPPVPCLSERWLQESDDASDEVALASALATLSIDRYPISSQLFPMVTLPRRIRRWSDHAGGISLSGTLVDALVEVAQHRARLIADGEAGLEVFRGARGIPLDVWSCFLRGQANDARVLQLLLGLSLVDRGLPHVDSGDVHGPVPGGIRLLKLFFVNSRLTERIGMAGAVVSGDDRTHPLTPLKRVPEIIALLRARKGQAASDLGASALCRAGGLRIPAAVLRFPTINEHRVIAALLIPLDRRAQRLIARDFARDEKKTQTEQPLKENEHDFEPAAIE